MLVLSRRVGEKIVLPDCEVTITVLKSAGNNIRLGFEAPNSIRVYREEVLQRIAERFPRTRGTSVIEGAAHVHPRIDC